MLAASQLVAASSCLPACDKGPDDAPRAAATPTAGSAGQPTASAASSIAPTATPSPSPAGGWHGRYSARRAVVEVPPGVPDKTWAEDDGSQATGDGTIELSIDEADQVTGSAQGPLGPLKIRGALTGTHLRAGVAPADLDAAVAMWGMLVGQVGPDKAQGELRVSNRDGRLVRSASIELRRR